MPSPNDSPLDGVRTLTHRLKVALYVLIALAAISIAGGVISGQTWAFVAGLGFLKLGVVIYIILASYIMLKLNKITRQQKQKNLELLKALEKVQEATYIT